MLRPAKTIKRNEYLKTGIDQKMVRHDTSGEKTEEYREIKPYWVKRLTSARRNFDDLCLSLTAPDFSAFPPIGVLRNFRCEFRKFEYVEFVNGYGDHRPRFVAKFDGIDVGVGNPAWGAPNTPVFIIKVGEIVSKENIA